MPTLAISSFHIQWLVHDGALIFFCRKFSMVSHFNESFSFAKESVHFWYVSNFQRWQSQKIWNGWQAEHLAQKGPSLVWNLVQKVALNLYWCLGHGNRTENSMTEFPQFLTCCRGKSFKSFDTSHLKKICFFLDMFKFFRGHYRQNSTFFMILCDIHMSPRNISFSLEIFIVYRSQIGVVIIKNEFVSTIRYMTK
jgi:hypothetical protein